MLVKGIPDRTKARKLGSYLCLEFGLIGTGGKAWNILARGVDVHEVRTEGDQGPRVMNGVIIEATVLRLMKTRSKTAGKKENLEDLYNCTRC
jgi:hypothetical protein